MDLRVGQRVKVVAPDPYSGKDEFVGERGRIIEIRAGALYPYWVAFDEDDKGDDTWPFTSQELAPLDATTIDGVVDASGMFEWCEGSVDVGIDKRGKRVRVTIEVIDS